MSLSISTSKLHHPVPGPGPTARKSDFVLAVAAGLDVPGVGEVLLGAAGLYGGYLLAKGLINNYSSHSSNKSKQSEQKHQAADAARKKAWTRKLGQLEAQGQGNSSNAQKLRKQLGQLMNQITSSMVAPSGIPQAILNPLAPPFTPLGALGISPFDCAQYGIVCQRR